MKSATYVVMVQCGDYYQRWITNADNMTIAEREVDLHSDFDDDDHEKEINVHTLNQAREMDWEIPSVVFELENDVILYDYGS